MSIGGSAYGPGVARVALHAPAPKRIPARGTRRSDLTRAVAARSHRCDRGSAAEVLRTVQSLLFMRSSGATPAHTLPGLRPSAARSTVTTAAPAWWVAGAALSVRGLLHSRQAARANRSGSLERAGTAVSESRAGSSSSAGEPIPNFPFETCSAPTALGDARGRRTTRLLIIRHQTRTQSACTLKSLFQRIY